MALNQSMFSARYIFDSACRVAGHFVTVYCCARLVQKVLEEMLLNEAKQVIEAHKRQTAGARYEGFRDFMKSYRLTHNLTYMQMAALLNISRTRIHDYEVGSRAVTVWRAICWASSLGITREKAIELALQDLLNKSGLSDVLVEAFTED